MSYFWTAVCFSVGGFVCGTIWGRWIQSAALDKLASIFKKK